MYKLIRDSVLIALGFCLVLSFTQTEVSSAGLLDDIKQSSNNILDSVSNLCVTSDGCNKNFFTVNNYCCTGRCCNFVQYIFNNDNTWDNFKYTCENPRAINILLFVLIVLVLCAVVSMLMSLIGYFCCGCSRFCCCCGSRKYTIVSH